MNPTLSERAIVLAPRGRDAEVAGAMLRNAGIDAEPADGLTRFVTLLHRGGGFALVTEEALRGADLRSLDGFIRAQPEWSDFPFILLTERGGGLERNPGAQRFLETLGNVTFLERPFHPTTLVSLARSALRARRRQYEARIRLETIRSGEEQLRVALAAGGLGAWTLDVENFALKASRDCKAHFGRGPQDAFTYDDLRAAVHPDDRDYMQAAVTESLEKMIDYNVEYRCVWPNGTTHWVQVRGRPRINPASGGKTMTGVSQDISDRKASEEALRSFAVELEERVEERTRERQIAIAQLHEAQKLEMLGQLTGGVAHDFNNLLTPIVGGLDILARMHQDVRSQRWIKGALHAADRAQTLVARLLAFARRQNLETRPVDVGRLIDGLRDLVERTIGPQIRVTMDLPVDLPAALVDPNQLELAILNLAVNARDAMIDGGTLTIEADRVSAPVEHAQLAAGDYVRLRIRDTGTGMDAATLTRAIEPFYSTKGVGKGTGLGLSMVHGLAAQSGGMLSLTSKPGEGTTADLWLPASPAQAEDACEVTIAAPETGPLTVLVVDDEALVRQGTADMLVDLGHHVVEAGSAAAGLDLLTRQSVDLVVTDYLMPEMNGLEFATAVRERHGPMPILLVSGFADMAEGAGGDVVRLAKPYRRHDLAEAIFRLAGDPVARQAPATP